MPDNEKPDPDPDTWEGVDEPDVEKTGDESESEDLIGRYGERS